MDKQLSILEFCDIQGVRPTDKYTLNKKYSNSDKKTYDKWYSTVSKEFRIGDKKKFSSTTTNTDKTTKSNTK